MSPEPYVFRFLVPRPSRLRETKGLLGYGDENAFGASGKKDKGMETSKENLDAVM